MAEGQPAKSVLKMDASDMEAGLRSLTAEQAKFNKEVRAAADVLKSLGFDLTNTNVVVNKVAEGGHKLSAIVGEVEDRVKILSSTVKISNEGLIRFQKLFGEAPVPGRTNWQNSAKVVKELTASMYQNATQQEKMARRLEDQNRKAAGFVRTQLLQSTPAVPGATGKEVTAVNEQINKIKNAVAAGAISMQRALQIVDEQIKGVAGSYTNSEQAIANAAQRMIKAQQNLGSEAAKAAKKAADETRALAIAQQKAADEITAAAEKARIAFLKEQQAAATKASNQAAGNLLGSELRTTFLKGRGDASPAEVAKLVSEITRIQDAVARGEVSLARANEIMHNSIVGIAVDYTAAEVKVSNSTQRLIKAANGLGVETAKAAEEVKKATRDAAEAQLEADRKIQASTKEGLRIQREAKAERLRAQRSVDVGSTLKREFITPGFSTAEEVTRVASAISKVQALVQSGSVSAKVALNIVRSVAAGTADTYTGTAAKVAAAATQLVSANKGLGAEYDKIAAAAEKARKQTEKATKGIGLSWQAMGRLFLIQTAHTIVTNLSNAMRAAVGDAATFQVSISEIRTIAQDNQLSFESWAGAVRGLSDQFGKPIDDVAKGTYELISNQVTAGTDAILLMQKALTFAQVAVTSTANAVNLLSSALKSYNLDQSQADIVAAQFFATIDLGRVRADDLANTFGRVAPLASSLGIALSELNASIAVLSVQGVTPSESLTAIQGVMTKLLRPTKETKELFKEWGVESGKAAIATFGFGNVLEKFARAAASGNAEIGEIFNEIRATRGFIGLQNITGEFERVNNEIKNASIGKYLAAQEIAVESTGKAFQITGNKIKNFFIEDFGKSVLEAIVWLSNIGGAASSANSFFGGLLVTLQTTLVTFTGYKILARIAPQLAAFAAESLLASKAQSFLGLSVGKATLALGAISFVLLKWHRTNLETTQFHSESQAIIAQEVDKATKAYTASLNARTGAIEDATKKQYQIYFENVAAVNRLYNQVAEAQKRSAKLATEAMKNSFDILTDNIQKNISRIQDQITQTNNNIKKAGEQLADSMEGLNRGRFERQVKLAPEGEQPKLLLDRAAQLAASANSSLRAKADDATQLEENLAQATRERQEAERINNELLDRRVASQKKALELEDKIGELTSRSEFTASINEQADAIRALQDELAGTAKKPRGSRARSRKEIQDQLREARGEVGDEREEESVRRQAAKLADLKQELATHQQILKELPDRAGFEKLFTDQAKEYQKALRENVGLNQKIRDEAQKAAEIEKKRFEFLKDSFKALGAIKVTDKIDTPEEKAKLLKEFDTRLAEAQDAGGLNDQSVLKSLVDQRVELEKEANLQIQHHNDEISAKGLETEKENRIKLAQELAAKQNELNTARETAIQAAFRLTGEAKTVSSDNIVGVLSGLLPGDKASGEVQQATASISKLLTDLNENLKVGNQQEANVNRFNINKQLDFLMLEIVKQRPFSFAQTTGDIKIGTEPGKERDLSNVQQEFNDAVKAAFEASTKMTRILQLQSELTQKNAQDKIIPEALIPGAGKTKVDDMAKFGSTFTDALNNSSDATKRFNAAIDESAVKLRNMFPNLGAPQTKAHGGSIFWRARGFDTVPAMLRPGEFVVNPDATRRFYPELLAMNSGRTPQYFAHGGLVVPSPVVQTISRIQTNDYSAGNVEVGNINVYQTSTGNAKVDAQEIGEELRRRILSGRLTLPANRSKR